MVNLIARDLCRADITLPVCGVFYAQGWVSVA